MLNLQAIDELGYGRASLDPNLLPNPESLPDSPIRDAQNQPWCESLIHEAGMILPGEANHDWRLVRASYFAKSRRRNWSVPWHQDSTIEVKRPVAVSGFSAWSQKNSVCRVRPPKTVLQSMLTLRILLDDCDATDGPMELVEASHLLGILESAKRREVAETGQRVVCSGLRGEVLGMRPLVVHRSCSSTSQRLRPILHLEFATADLPGEVEWRQRIAIRRAA